jgi:drug/metabolite transporter (DMT)-like permease
MAAQFWSVAAAEKDAKEAAESEATGYAVAVATWLLSSGVYIVAKWAIAEMSPWTLCFWRVLIALIILLPLVRHMFPAMRELLRRHWLALLITGGIGFAITQGLMYTALEYTSAVNVGLIFAMMPIFTMALARIVLNEAMGPWQIVGSLIATAGMMIIVVKGDLAVLASLSLDPGELLALASAFLFPVYSVLLKRAKFDLPRLPLLVLLIGAAVIVSSPFFLWELLNGEHANLDTRGYLALAYAAIPGGALMYLLFNWSVDVLGASRTGATMYLQTVFIAFLAWLLLGEAIEPYHIAGAAIILLGVLLVLALRPKPTVAPAK